MSLKNWQKKGYKVIQQSSNKRYKHAQLRKGKKYYFLKISKKQIVNLKNQVAWNNQINELSKGKDFCCPKVIESGKNYALFEYYPKLIGENFEKFIPKIVDLLFWMKKMKLNLPIDKEKDFQHDIGNTRKKILHLAKSYSKGKNLTGLNLEKLLKIIKNTTLRNKTLAHCEVKPKHLFDVNGKLGLIDGEWASIKIPEHYDFTSCYARTFIEKPKWAGELFLQYKKRCKDKNGFMKQFRGLLAWRVIGEYSDAYNEGNINNNHKELIRRVLENNF